MDDKYEKLIDQRYIHFDDLQNKNLQNFTEVVLTVYITSKKDPQRGIIQDSNSYDYIKPWYSTMKEKGLHGIIFHDNLSKEFIEKHETDKIFFIRSKIGQYSINDERYILYYKFLKQFPHYKFVLTTDVSDVFINKDPFPLLKENPNKIFVGTNFVGNGPKIKTPAWYDRREWKIKRFNKALKDCGYDQVGYFRNEYQIYNAGLIGGNRDDLFVFIGKIVLLIFITDNSKNNNMLLLNYVIVKDHIDGYSEKTFCTDTIHTGSPFNSVYKRGEKLGESKCCLIHK